MNAVEAHYPAPQLIGNEGLQNDLSAGLEQDPGEPNQAKQGKRHQKPRIDGKCDEHAREDYLADQKQPTRAQ